MPAAEPSDTNTTATTALGSAPVGRLLLNYGFQTTASVGIYGFYALSNAWFVSHGVGDTALAAVNLVAPLLLLLGAVSSTVGAGGAALVSLALGRQNHLAAAKAAGNSFILFWCAAIIVAICGLAFLEPLLDLLGAHGEVRGYARNYATVLLAGSIVSTGFSSLVRAEGRVRFSTIMWVSSVIIHIVLDPLLTFVFDLGVVGAAYGTIAGQLSSALLSMWFFFIQKNRAYTIRPADLIPDAKVTAKIVSIGAPTFLAGLGATSLAVIINQLIGATGVLAAAALAGFAVATRMQTFVVMPFTGIAQALAPIVAYNTGLGNHSRVTRACTLSLRSAALYGTTTAALVALCAPHIAGFFVAEHATKDIAAQALRVIALSFAVSGIASIVSAYFQSVGRPKPSYLITVGTLLCIRIPLVIGFGAHSLDALWWSITVGEALSAAVALALLRFTGTKVSLARSVPRI